LVDQDSDPERFKYVELTNLEKNKTGLYTFSYLTLQDLNDFKHIVITQGETYKQNIVYSGKLILTNLGNN